MMATQISDTTLVFSFKASEAPAKSQQFAQEWFPAEPLIYFNNVHGNFNCFRRLLNGREEMIGDNGIPNVYTSIGDILAFVKGQAEHWGVHYDIESVDPQSYDLLSHWRR